MPVRRKDQVLGKEQQIDGPQGYRVYNNDMSAILRVFALLSLCLAPNLSWSQPRVEDTTEYQSSYDDTLTFRQMTYLPSRDNVNGVYSKAINETLEELIRKNHKWNYTDNNAASANTPPEELVGNSSVVQSLSKSLNADGFFVSELRKDPKEVSIRLYLFSTMSGQLIAEQELRRTTDNTEIVKTAVRSLFARILEKIPYDALVASRTDNRVTINAGKRDGVIKGQNLTIVKIIGAKKHPKRNFIIKSNKAILGQIRVVKVDDYLSFADIISETEPGVIDKDAKVTGLSSIRYEATPWTKSYTPPEQLLSENNKVVFGKKAQEWVAKDPPTFGKVGADFSLGTFDNRLALADGSSLASKVPAYPRVNLTGEIWVTPKIYANAAFSQGIGSSVNPTGNPPEVSNSMTHYRMSFGYNFILRDEFFGPKFNVDIGFSSYRMFVDSAGASGFTTLQYRSMPIGIGGYVPINKTRTWAIGGTAYFHLFPSLNETPISSGGDPNNNINHFLFFAENKISQRLRWKIGMEFMILSTNFSGPGSRTLPATDLSHRFTLLSTGIDYLF